jgi:hypothetical protein
MGMQHVKPGRGCLAVSSVTTDIWPAASSRVASTCKKTMVLKVQDTL